MLETEGGNKTIIREATLSDACGIAKVHVDTWRTAYKGIINDEFLNELSYDKREEIPKRICFDMLEVILQN